MVTWKLALAVILIAILLILAGMWFGYRYVRQRDDISPAARTFNLPAIAEHIRPHRDANVGVGLIPNPTPISVRTYVTPVGAVSNRASYRIEHEMHVSPKLKKRSSN